MLLLNVNSESGVGGSATTDVLLALCVNLAWCERAAQQMAAEDRLRELLTRAFRHRNMMLMKLVRNLSHHLQNKPLFVVSSRVIYRCLGIVRKQLTCAFRIESKSW